MPKALILGSANTLEADRTAALELFTPDLIVACNHAFRDAPFPVDVGVTMHPEVLPKWIRERAALGHPPAGAYFHPRNKICKIESTAIDHWGGSSGLLCVQAALALGCDRIVLAGVPLEKNACHFNKLEKWYEASQYRPAWERHIDKFRDNVRSMSGWTRVLLGEPTKEWLNANPT